MIKTCFIILLFCCAPAHAGEQPDYIRIKCIVHLHTDVSGCPKPLESYVKEARGLGISAIVPTDEDWQRWEYGLPPFRKLVRIIVQQKSAMTFGMEKYLALIKDMNEKHKDVIVIDGVQTNPFYYWSGNFLLGRLTLNKRNEDMIVMGLGSADDYKNMPTIANRKSRFDAYHGDRHAEPYQDLIDYVTGKGGLVFWAHPELEENTLVSGVILVTAPYEWDLVGTEGYTGFSIYHTGYEKVGRPMGIWDRILTEYCDGRRGSPVWAIGDLEEEGEGNRVLDDVVNALYVKKLDRREILDAFRKGRFYATRKEFDRIPMALEEFSVTDESKTIAAIMGEEASFAGDPVIRARISHERPSDKKILVKLIRNNEVIKEFEGDSRIDIEYTDKDLSRDKKYYYRIDAKSRAGSELVTNPIFFIRR